MKKIFCITFMFLLTMFGIILPNFSNVELNAESVKITVENENESYVLNENLEIILSCTCPIEAEDIEWKVLKPNTTNFTSPIIDNDKSTIIIDGLNTTFKFKPIVYGEDSGIYSFVVKYKKGNNEFFTDIKNINILPKPITNFDEIIIQYDYVKHSKSNIQAFRFYLSGYDKYADKQKIEWFVGNQRQPFYGKEFIFEPDYEGTFTIRARIGNQELEPKIITAKIANTTAQILVIVGIAVILIIGLIIGIIINRKSERIW